MPKWLRSLEAEVNIADVLAKLASLQKELDAAGFQLASIYLEHAIDEVMAALINKPDEAGRKGRGEPN